MEKGKTIAIITLILVFLLGGLHYACNSPLIQLLPSTEISWETTIQPVSGSLSSLLPPLLNWCYVVLCWPTSLSHFSTEKFTPS